MRCLNEPSLSWGGGGIDLRLKIELDFRPGLLGVGSSVSLHSPEDPTNRHHGHWENAWQVKEYKECFFLKLKYF